MKPIADDILAMLLRGDCPSVVALFRSVKEHAISPEDAARHLGELLSKGPIDHERHADASAARPERRTFVVYDDGRGAPFDGPSF